MQRGLRKVTPRLMLVPDSLKRCTNLCVRTVLLRGVTLAVAALCFCGAATAQRQDASAKTDQELKATLEGITQAHHGSVAVFAHNLRTGEQVGLDENRPVQTASVIKLTILVAAAQAIREGRLHWTDPVVLHKDDQVAGSGVLQVLDTPVTLTFKDVLTLMIAYSDNTATNLAIDTVGLHAINAETRALGLQTTWLYKKVFKPATETMPPDQKVYGLGKTTAREMSTLLARMYRCEFTTAAQPGDRQLCFTMLSMLQKQSFRDGLPRLLDKVDSSEADASLGNKTGALDAVRNDVGIISTKAGPIVMAIFTFNNADTSWSSDNEGELTIAKAAQAIVQRWSPGGLDPTNYNPFKAETKTPPQP